MEEIKLKKQSFNDQLKLYIRNLDKLFTQLTDWQWKRHECALQENWKKAEYIEKTYITPLEKKISSFSSFVQQWEVEHGRK